MFDIDTRFLEAINKGDLYTLAAEIKRYQGINRDYLILLSTREKAKKEFEKTVKEIDDDIAKLQETCGHPSVKAINGAWGGDGHRRCNVCDMVL
jgi:hypothetical protein